jgi:hypothetical protein
MRTLLAASLAASSTLLLTPAAHASGGHATTLFTDIPGAVFLDIATDSSSTPFGPFIIVAGGQSVSITSSDQAGASPAFFGFFNYNNSPIYHLPYNPATDPGDYHGYLRSITPFVRHVVLDFDTPLTGFGMTFVIQRFFSAPDAPDTIYAFDGPGGTGNLIATVTTVDAPAINFRAQIDFIGVYVDGPPIIRSALIAGGPLAADYSELRITGIAVAIADDTPPCPSDYNADGTSDILDFLDFLDYIEDFSSCSGLPTPCGTLGNPDLTGDGLVDILDLLIFLDAFGQGC